MTSQLKRISWSAILTGALVGVGFSFLLNLFGVAIGLSAFSMGDQGVMSLAIGGLFGIIVSTIIAMFFAGFTSGYIGRLYVPGRNMAGIYGFSTWIVAIILTAVLTTHLGSYIESYSTSVTRSTVIITQDKTAEAMTSKSHASSHEEHHKIANITPKEVTGGIAIGAFIVFAMFFIGALSSCVGARFGMRCTSED